MARYKKHVIRYGETPQSIAALEMGDATSWIDLVKYNSLQYPYIVARAKDKISNPDHLVTLGDTLIIPLAVTLSSDELDGMNQQDKDEIATLALGRDLSMIDFPAFYSNRGTHDGILQLNASNGDLTLATGLKNIKQVVIDHLLTPKGSLILHPNYGSSLHDMFNRGSVDNIKLVDDEVSRCILSDARISDAKKLSSTLRAGKYTSNWAVVIESVEAQFTFVIGRDDTGNFTIS